MVKSQCLRRLLRVVAMDTVNMLQQDDGRCI